MTKCALSLSLSLAAMLQTGGVGSLLAAPTASKPNVLFIIVDDLKPLLGCYGDQKIQSPNLDRLAARGLRFDRAYCNQAVCSPSRNALLTGLRPTTIGIYDLATNFRDARPETVTLGQWFKQQGWRTEALGKVFHVGHGNHDDPASWSLPVWTPKAPRYALKENKAVLEANTSAAVKAGLEVETSTTVRGLAVECADLPDNTYGDGLIAEEGVRRLRAARENSGQPFFITLGFAKPHLPFVAPKKYWDLYERSSFPLPRRQTPPDGAPEFAATTWGELRNYTDIPDVGPLTPELQRQLIHGYHAAVSYTDAQVGRVLDELDRLGLAENTIIVLWGDHGWHLGDHGMWCKHTNYEEATRIPLFFVAPKVTKPKTHSAALVETVDIFPTLCQLVKIPPPPGLEGTSLVPVLGNPGTKTKDAVFQAYPRLPKGVGPILGLAVRTERYRLVEWKAVGAPADTAILELYDYQADPDETQNLAQSQPEVVAQLRAILARQPEAKPQFVNPDSAVADGNPGKKKKPSAPYIPEAR